MRPSCLHRHSHAKQAPPCCKSGRLGHNLLCHDPTCRPLELACISAYPSTLALPCNIALPCSLPDTHMLRANCCRRPALPQTTPAPLETRFHREVAPVSTLLGSSRSAFSKAALKHRAAAARHQTQPYEVPAPALPGGARSLQRAATLPPLPDDTLFSNACLRYASSALSDPTWVPGLASLLHHPTWFWCCHMSYLLVKVYMTMCPLRIMLHVGSRHCSTTRCAEAMHTSSILIATPVL